MSDLDELQSLRQQLAELRGSRRSELLAIRKKTKEECARVAIETGWTEESEEIAAAIRALP